MKIIALLLTMLVPAVVSAQQKPTTGYAPVNGLKMYYEVHGSGEPVVLLHGAFMTITNNWAGWISELAKTRKVIAVEMQGQGRTADVTATGASWEGDGAFRRCSARPHGRTTRGADNGPGRPCPSPLPPECDARWPRHPGGCRSPARKLPRSVCPSGWRTRLVDF